MMMDGAGSFGTHTGRLEGAQIEALWASWLERRRPEDERRLLEHYIPLVRQYCRYYRSRLPASFDADDLVDAALWGLRGALASFDPARGAKFETYCVPRMRGAILDRRRRLDWAPRSIRERAAALAAARRELLARFGRAASDEEVREHLGLDEATLRRWVQDERTARVFSLDRAAGADAEGEQAALCEVVPDERFPAPPAAAQRHDLRDVILASLPERERTVVMLYYYDDLTMQEIALVLGLTESRISQIHSSAMKRLRLRLAGRAAEFEPLGE